MRKSREIRKLYSGNRRIMWVAGNPGDKREKCWDIDKRNVRNKREDEK